MPHGSHDRRQSCRPLRPQKLLIASSVVFLLSAYGTGYFSHFSYFLAARFLSGVGIGMASGLSPMYIAEVAPSHIRGKLVSLNQLTIVIGILAAQITNWLIAEPVVHNTMTHGTARWDGAGCSGREPSRRLPSSSLCSSFRRVRAGLP